MRSMRKFSRRSKQDFLTEMCQLLVNTYFEAGGTRDEFMGLAYNDRLIRDLIGVQRGSHQIWPVAKELSPIVRVDRTSPLMYPLWTKKVLHPELELAGPAEYNLETDVERWFYSDQGSHRREVVKDVYRQIEARGLLPGFLGLRDAVTIQQRGLEFFRKYFQGKKIHFWPSAVTDRRGLSLVPYLEDGDNDVLLCWQPLSTGVISNYESCHMALRFKRPSPSSSVQIKA